MNDALAALMQFEGLAHTTTLLAFGTTAKQLERAVADGSAIRVRRGWYAVAGLDTMATRALRLGGQLSCVSLLALHGVWLPFDERMHVATGESRARLRSPKSRARPFGSDEAVVTHRRRRLADPHSPVESVESAFGCAAACLPADDAVIMLDSVRNLRLLEEHQIERAIAALPASRRTALTRSAEGAESGTESLVRMLLAAHRLAVRTQVLIDGVGRVDLVVGDRLVIEVDSRAHHDNPKAYERDRARDLALVALGYVVIRVTYHRVMHDPESIERAVLAVVRRRDHLWPRRSAASRESAATTDRRARSIR